MSLRRNNQHVQYNLDYPAWLKTGMSAAVTMDTGMFIFCACADAHRHCCLLSGWIKAWFIHSIIRHIQLSGHAASGTVLQNKLVCKTKQFTIDLHVTAMLNTSIDLHCQSYVDSYSSHACRYSSGVYSGGLWGLEHPPVLPDNHETNLAISSVLV